MYFSYYPKKLGGYQISDLYHYQIYISIFQKEVLLLEKVLYSVGVSILID